MRKTYVCKRKYPFMQIKNLRTFKRRYNQRLTIFAINAEEACIYCIN